MSDYARPIVHFQIRARDRTRLQEFYSALFNWQIDDNNPMSIGRIEHGIGGPPEGISGSVVQSESSAVAVYVQVADLRASIEKAERLGGKAVMPPMDVPDGPTIAQVQDPEGNLVGLVQQ